MVKVAEFHYSLSSAVLPIIHDLIVDLKVSKEKISTDISSEKIEIFVDISENEWLKLVEEDSRYLGHCFFEYFPDCNEYLHKIAGWGQGCGQ